jgi:Putative auto-transporter adhesin, head GIN domain
MKSTRLALAAAAVALCGLAQAETAEQQRALGSFHRIRVEGSFDVQVSPGMATQALVRGDAKLLSKVLTQVEGDTLVVRPAERISWMQGTPQVRVQVPAVDMVELLGSGNLALQSFKLPALTVRVAGSGDVDGRELQIESLEVRLAGSGDIRLSGRCTTAAMAVAGSGDISAGELDCRQVRVSVAGSGDASVRATERLEASVAGSGDVRYLGRPAQVQRASSGSGTIQPAD